MRTLRRTESDSHGLLSSDSRRPRKRITLELPETLIDEVRDAAYWLSGPPHQLTLTAIAEEALVREIQRIKQDHNHGQAFKPRTGPLRTGRPLGS